MEVNNSPIQSFCFQQNRIVHDQSHFTNLPIEIISKVMSKLQKTDIANVRRTCRKLDQVSRCNLETVNISKLEQIVAFAIPPINFNSSERFVNFKTIFIEATSFLNRREFLQWTRNHARRQTV